jgi:hypothetical protein
VVARIYRKATKLAAAAFLKVLVAAVPYKVHTVLTGAKVYPERQAHGFGVQFVQRERSGDFVAHVFEASTTS